MIFIQKVKLNKLLIFIFVGIIAILINILIDRWFYGDFVFTPWSYFAINLIESKAAEFGVFPWWFYIPMALYYIFPPISIILVVYFFKGIKFDKNNILLWIFIPFFIGHSIIGHKEIRFLFPIIFPFLYYAGLGIDRAILKGKNLKWRKFIFYLVFILNIPLLAFRMFYPAQESIKYYNFL